jgi:hypothetical protein
MLLLSLLTLAVLREGSLYTHCHRLTQIPDLSMVQYNIAILGGPLVTHVNVVFSSGKLQGARGTSVTTSLGRVDRRVCSSVEKVFFGFCWRSDGKAAVVQQS